jgi:hypothetical protein
MEDKLREIINKIVREEIMGEITIVDKNTKPNEVPGENPQTIQTAIDQAKKSNQPVKVAEMARAAEVKYTLKPDFRGELESVQGKLSKAEFRSLVDIVKVLKDAGQSLTATDIL